MSNIVLFPGEAERNQIKTALLNQNQLWTEFDDELRFFGKCFGEYLSATRGLNSDAEKLRYAIGHEEEIRAFARQVLSMGLFARFLDLFAAM